MMRFHLSPSRFFLFSVLPDLLTFSVIALICALFMWFSPGFTILHTASVLFCVLLVFPVLRLFKHVLAYLFPDFLEKSGVDMIGFRDDMSQALLSCGKKDDVFFTVASETALRLSLVSYGILFLSRSVEGSASCSWCDRQGVVSDVSLSSDFERSIAGSKSFRTLDAVAEGVGPELVGDFSPLSVFVPFYSSDGFEGGILFDRKLDGHAFTKEELGCLFALQTLVRAALGRIRPYEEIKREYVRTLELSEKVAAQASYARVIQHIGHEINNPVGMIVSRVEVTMDRADDPEFVRESMRVIEDVVRRIKKVAKSFLDYGKSGGQFEKSLVDINESVSQVVDTCRSECLQHEIQLVDRLEEGLPQILGDPYWIYHVLFNIVVNAIQAMSDMESADDAMLVLATSAKSFTDVDGVSRDGICVEIQDTGPGISDEVKEKMFDPCFTTKPSKNTGLGLSTVLKRVQDHGGILECETELGRGTLFRVFFPS